MIMMLFELLGSLGIFLFGMRVMSDGIQKVAGDRMQKVLDLMTQNRFIAVFTGFFITALIQSSSATTVMVVSFVNAGLLTLSQSIGVIMGANIGTTVTTWIVSFVGFKFKIAAFALPIIGVGLPFFLSKRRKKRDFGEILVGFGLLFLGLAFLKESVPDIKQNPELLSFLQNYTNLGFLSFLIFVGVGSVLTIIVQSSSAALAITVTMAFKGWIDFPTAAAVVLGENIGTTVTAYLASIGTSVNAQRAARAHFLFNFLGVFWMAFIFRYFIKFIYQIAPWDPLQQGNFPLNLSLFHSIFNITNTLIFIGFIPVIAKIVEKMVKAKPGDIPVKYQLKYISTGLQDTATMNLLNARNEIKKMAQITEEMFNSFLDVFFHPKEKKGHSVEKIKQMEELTDQMQEEISKYLVKCSNEELSEANVKNVNALMRIVNELENIADSCFKLIILTQRKYDKKITLHEKAREEVTDFSNLVLEFIKFYKARLNKPLLDQDLNIAFRLERKINHSRDNLKRAAQRRLQSNGNVKSELLYIDLLKNFEHIGDNALNIAQALNNMT
ncbi:MAG: Na/Pi cotransporter [Candidatus Cloacimonas sp. SDB]|nr:MAG: Na/Pi cotransporter [Candidatus Cloacimonas sp. SDB]